MYKFQKNLTPKIFNNDFKSLTINITFQFSEYNFKYKTFSLTNTKYSISVWGPKIWNELLTKDEKKKSLSIFLVKVRTILLEDDNEGKYF